MSSTHNNHKLTTINFCNITLSTLLHITYHAHITALDSITLVMAVSTVPLEKNNQIFHDNTRHDMEFRALGLSSNVIRTSSYGT